MLSSSVLFRRPAVGLFVSRVCDPGPSLVPGSPGSARPLPKWDPLCFSGWDLCPSQGRGGGTHRGPQDHDDHPHVPTSLWAVSWSGRGDGRDWSPCLEPGPSPSPRPDSLHPRRSPLPLTCLWTLFPCPPLRRVLHSCRIGGGPGCLPVNGYLWSFPLANGHVGGPSPCWWTTGTSHGLDPGLSGLPPDDPDVSARDRSERTGPGAGTSTSPTVCRPVIGRRGLGRVWGRTPPSRCVGPRSTGGDGAGCGDVHLPATEWDVDRRLVRLDQRGRLGDSEREVR